MKINDLATYLCLVALILVSCKKDEPIEPPVDNSYPAGTLDLGSDVNADFFGRVVDANGEAVSNASVIIGDLSTVTDNNGAFKLDAASVPSKLAYIKVTKSGYFTGAKSIIPQTNALNFVQITLVEKQLTHQFASGTPTTVSVQNGVSIDFPDNYLDQFGTEYFGQVKVYASYVAPDDVDIDKFLGASYGQGKDAVERYFENYGMLMVELEGNSGQAISLAPGDAATIHMRVDANQISNAPSGIPMVYFDEKVGYWVENGWATLSGDEYAGTVTHFDSWSFAAAYSAAQVSGFVTNDLGDSLSNFVIETNSLNGAAHIYTASNGKFNAYVPSDQVIDLSTFDECGTATIITSVGPFSSGTNGIGDFQIPNGSVNLTKQVGQLLDCGASAVNNGYVVMTVGNGSYIQHVADGNFEVHIINCNSASTYEAYGFDMSTNEQSIVYQKDMSGNINQTGTIVACAATSEYISFSIDAVSPILYTADLFCGQLDSGGGPYFTAYPIDHSIEIISQVFTEGSYSYYANQQPNTVWVHPDDMYNFASFSIQSVLIEWPANPGGYLQMTFHGFYTDVLLNQHTISGDMVVLRDS